MPEYSFDKKDMLEYIERRVSDSGSQKAFAEECGISPAFLSDILKGKREISQRILEKLKFKKVVYYEKAYE